MADSRLVSTMKVFMYGKHAPLTQIKWLAILLSNRSNKINKVNTHTKTKNMEAYWVNSYSVIFVWTLSMSDPLILLTSSQPY